MSKCELCGSEVRVVGKTTQHYEPINVEALIREAIAQTWEEARYEVNTLKYSPTIVDDFGKLSEAKAKAVEARGSK